MYASYFIFDICKNAFKAACKHAYCEQAFTHGCTDSCKHVCKHVHVHVFKHVPK